MARWQPADASGRHRAGHGHQRAVQVPGVPGRVQRPAAQRRLDHHGAPAERGDQPVAHQEPGPGRRPARRLLADQRPMGGDGLEQLVVGPRVRHIEPGGQDRDGDPLGGERAAVRLAVDPERPAGDHCPAPLGQGRREFGGHVDAVAGGRPGPDDGHRAQAGEPEINVAAHPQAPRPPRAQRVELAGPLRVTRAHQPDPVPLPRLHRGQVGASPSRAAHRGQARSRPGMAGEARRAVPADAARRPPPRVAAAPAGAPSWTSPGSATQVSAARASRSWCCPSGPAVTGAPPATGRARSWSGRRTAGARPARSASVQATRMHPVAPRAR